MDIEKISEIKFENIGEIGAKIIKLCGEADIKGLDIVAVLHIVCQTLETHLNIGEIGQIDKAQFQEMMTATLKQGQPEEAPPDDVDEEDEERDFINQILEQVPTDMLEIFALTTLLLGFKNKEFTYTKIRKKLDMMEKQFPYGT